MTAESEAQLEEVETTFVIITAEKIIEVVLALMPGMM